MGLIKRSKSKEQISDDEQESKKAKPAFPFADFNPYAAFYNDHTILTKNGELLQTIKIPLSAVGLPSEEAEHTGVYLRDLVRRSMKEHGIGPELSHWLHIFRDRQPIAELSFPPTDFAEELQDSWLGAQRVAYSYYNVCYITIIIQGQSADLFDMSDFKKGARKRQNRKFRSGYLEGQVKKLETVVSELRSDLEEHFRVERLGMVERQTDEGPQYFSENMEWLHRIANISQEPMPVSEVDLSQQLETSELVFGFDALESRNKHHKRFASILSIKHYHELPAEVFDRFLQMPVEMIVTQASHFILAKTAMGELNKVNEVLKHSEDEFVAQHSGFADVLAAKQGNDTDFSRQQTTIMLLTDHYQELEDVTTEMQTVISNIGLLSVKEDIKLEEIFWSQLPGNFEFIRRPQAVPTDKVDGFARLNFYPTGKHKGRWGEPITIMPTETKTPYLFHFHHEQVGHTAVIDFNSFPDVIGTRLTHFLMAMASKQATRIMMFDRHGAGEMVTKAMDGSYLRAGGQQHSLSINPFAMECVPGNQGFLAAWLALLLGVGPDDADKRDAIRACVGQGWDEQSASEGFAGLVKTMQSLNPAMADELRQMMERPAFGACMSSGLDNVAFDKRMSAVNIHIDAFNEDSAVAIFSYLLHRAILTLDGTPTLLVIKDAWEVLEHPFFASRIKSLMDMLTERNAALLLATREPEKLPSSVIMPMMSDSIVTKLIIPDDIPCDYLLDTLGYTKAEEGQLLRMERQKGDVLVVHDDEMIATRIDIADSQKQAILSGDAKTLQTMKSSQGAG